MDSIVVLQQVPDARAGLPVAPEGRDLDRDRLQWVTNPFDEFALEEALLLREDLGGTVIAVALDAPGADEALYRALALGATGAVLLTGLSPGWVSGRSRAEALAAWIRTQAYDLVLSGVQAPDDLDGQLPVLLAGLLGHPHASVIVEVEADGTRLIVTQEHSGGRLARLALTPPAVLGIQSSLRDPRYVSEMRIRLASMGGGVQRVAATPGALSGAVPRHLAPPPAARRAEMLEGDAAEVAAALVGLLRARGLLA
ncbi:MAG TPA: electron transfer flavoprotein subunit beta/FixA family protein [Actinomycetota bacterium]|nr:electron transfer flavoprotein subunit beta/FixA family protein [Actinomycetota bacterium]